MTILPGPLELLPDDELIVLLAESGEEVGRAPKLASHHADTPLHLAFSCWVFDEQGRFLLTRRALSKETWPGVWTNSLCGHPLPGEPLHAAVSRRLLAELGTVGARMDVILPFERYRAVMPNGIVENEIGPLLRILPRLPVTPAPEEIAEVSWVEWGPFVDRVLSGSQDISPWSLLAVRKLASLGPAPWQWPAADPGLLPAALRERP